MVCREQLALAGLHRAASSALGVVHARARAARRARRAARSRRRACRRDRARCAPRPPGTRPRRRAAAGSRRDRARRGRARRERVVHGPDRVSVDREREHVGGPSCAHEPLVQLGDGRLVDEQHRQLGVRPVPLRPASTASASALHRAMSTGTSFCSSATNTSGLPSSPPTRRGRSDRGGGSVTRAGVRSLVCVDDVLHDAVAHHVGAR